ncbi:MAG: hypothetical protein FWB79_05155 [Treponema sp.]|nr:hypothetical protein [Treponema sp.]
MDVLDHLLGSIDFWGLTQDEVVGQDGLIKQLTGKILRCALEAEASWVREKFQRRRQLAATGTMVLLENQSATVEVPRDLEAVLAVYPPLAW